MIFIIRLFLFLADNDYFFYLSTVSKGFVFGYLWLFELVDDEGKRRFLCLNVYNDDKSDDWIFGHILMFL